MIQPSNLRLIAAIRARLVWISIGTAWGGLLILHSIAHHLNWLLLHLHWQLMLIAMMMPSALPVFRSLKQLTPRLIDQIGFIFPYWLIWSSFAFVLGWKPFAHPGHSMNSYAFPWLLWQGIILVGAGIFQFTPLKQSCLEGCRSAVSMLLTYYDQSIRSMVGLGIRYAVNCLGCCWALMAVMLVAGMNNIVLMVALTFVMSVERQWKHGKLFSLIIGGLLIVAGAALLALPLYKQVIA